MNSTAQELQDIFAFQIIPWWEGYGQERLAVSEPTLRQFQAQVLPPSMVVARRSRRSGKMRPRTNRSYNNVAMVSEIYPADAQETCRHPMLYCVIRGEANLHVSDYAVRCRAGNFILMRPGVPQPDGSHPHLESGREDGYCEIMHFSLLPGSSAVGIWICMSRPKQHQGRAYLLVHHAEIVAQFHLFMREMLDPASEEKKIASNALHNFFLLVLRELNAGRIRPSVQDAELQALPVGENAINFAMRYIESHLHLPLTSTKVAEAVYMSRSNFLRHFTRATGQNFNQYVTALRLRKAVETLSSGTFSIQATCAQIGIKPAQLYRLFKRHYNMSPSEFRQQRMRQKE